MRRIITGLSLLLLCVTAALGMDREPDSYTPAQWHSDADATSDAQRAIAHDDLRLLAYMNRGLIIPATSGEDIDQLKQRCGIRELVGAGGDVIRSDKQQLRMKQQHAYMRAYNSIILVRCHSTQ